MLNAFRQAIKALTSNLTRTALTTLGIVIGIATVILVLSAGAGFRSLINAQISTLGTNTLTISTRVPPTTKSRAAGAGGPGGGGNSSVTVTTFKQTDVDDIKKLNNVANAYGSVSGGAVASYRDNEKNVTYTGASASRFEVDKHTLKEGRFYTKSEDSGGAQVVILGSSVAKDLFGQTDPLGQLVRLGTLNFQVIGVYNPQGGFGGDDSMYIPLVTAQKKMLGIDYLTSATVQLQNQNLASSTSAQITSVLRQNHNITDPAKDDFQIMSASQALSSFNTIFNGITILLVAIAAISLIVGGVGIMNIMYVIVTERTAEIGLKKALGARNSDIRNEFLVESVLVTLLGGFFGIALGSGLSLIVYFVAKAFGLAWSFTVPFYAIALGFGVSAAIGITFGVLPARSAAKLNPIEALGYE